jgi:hypothetical protein
MQRIWIKIIYAILQACGLFVASGTAGYVINPKFLQCGTYTTVWNAQERGWAA